MKIKAILLLLGTSLSSQQIAVAMWALNTNIAKQLAADTKQEVASTKTPQSTSSAAMSAAALNVINHPIIFGSSATASASAHASGSGSVNISITASAQCNTRVNLQGAIIINGITYQQK